MLVLRLENWKGGDPRRAEELGRVTIANVSDGAAVSDYECTALDSEGDAIGEVYIYGHRRTDGAWALVRRVVERLMAGSGTGTGEERR